MMNPNGVYYRHVYLKEDMVSRLVELVSCVTAVRCWVGDLMCKVPLGLGWHPGRAGRFYRHATELKPLACHVV